MAFEYFTLAELRALPDMASTTTYTDARCDAVAAGVVATIEREVGTSFVSRSVTDERHDGGTYEVFLRKPYILSVTTAAVSGVAVTDTLRLVNGAVRRYSTAATSPTWWAAGFDTITITYASGYSTVVPADVKEAALQATRFLLIAKAPQASMNDRATSISNEFGNVNLSVAGKDAPFGVPAVDSVVVAWRRTLKPVLV